MESVKSAVAVADRQAIDAAGAMKELSDFMGAPRSLQLERGLQLLQAVLSNMKGHSEEGVVAMVPVALVQNVVTLLLECDSTASPNAESRTAWGYADSPDDARWSGLCDTREEAIAEAYAAYGSNIIQRDQLSIWVVSGRVPTAGEFIPRSTQILEMLREQAADDVGEASEGFAEDVSDEAELELNTLLTDWANRHLEVSFWTTTGTPEEIKPPPREGATAEDRPTATSLPDSSPTKLGE